MISLAFLPQQFMIGPFSKTSLKLFKVTESVVNAIKMYNDQSI